MSQIKRSMILHSQYLVDLFVDLYRENYELITKFI